MGIGRFRASALSLGLAGVLSALSVLPGHAATTTVVVTPADLESSKTAAMTNGKWFFYNDEDDTVNNTLGSFVIGPGAVPAGVGSAQVSVSGTQRRNLATYRFSGTPLTSISTLKYRTYNPSAGNGGSASRSGYLQFNVDFDGSDTWQRRLTFLPSDNGTVTPDTWKEWDAFAGGAAKWRYSGTTWPAPNAVPGTTPKTWSQILADYPGVRIRVTDAFLGIRVGEPYADGYTENIDTVTFGTGSNVTVFDFEPVPQDKDDCKNGGWQVLRRANGTPFKNQGDCVSYTNNGK